MAINYTSMEYIEDAIKRTTKRLDLLESVANELDNRHARRIMGVIGDLAIVVPEIEQLRKRLAYLKRMAAASSKGIA